MMLGSFSGVIALRAYLLVAFFQGQGQVQSFQSSGGFSLRRKLTALVALFFILALAVIETACSGSDPNQPDDSAPLCFDLNSPKIKERLGEDDGFALTILYGGDIHGSLETCG